MSFILYCKDTAGRGKSRKVRFDEAALPTLKPIRRMSGVPEVSMLGTLFLLIYLNYSFNLQNNARFIGYVDYISIFLTVTDGNQLINISDVALGALLD